MDRTVSLPSGKGSQLATINIRARNRIVRGLWIVWRPAGGHVLALKNQFPSSTLRCQRYLESSAPLTGKALQLQPVLLRQAEEPVEEGRQ